MDQPNNPDTTNVKVESSTHDNESESKINNVITGRRFGNRGNAGRYGRGRGNQRSRAPRAAEEEGNFEGKGIKKDVERDDQQGDHADKDESFHDGGRMPGRPRRSGFDNIINDRIQQISGSTFDLPPVEMSEKKFNGRSRLYVGNLGPQISEGDLTELFKPYGETAEIFVNKEKHFGFVKLDYRINAEKAKKDLDGISFKSSILKIRFASNSATVKIKNLTPYISNELLHYAFSVFGEIERAIVCVDERGKPTGEGIVDFSQKVAALCALRKCSTGCYFLTGALRPCIVEAWDVVDDTDGYPDRKIPKKNTDFIKEREMGPRFAIPSSFEEEYGMRWKQLYELYAQKQEALKKELELEKEKLHAQMEYARYEHETELLRDELRAREMDKERQKREWEMKQRQVEEEKFRTEQHMKLKREEMESRMSRQQEGLRKQQENGLFMQAHNLTSMLDQQEEAWNQSSGFSNRGMNETELMEPKSFMSIYEKSDNIYERRDVSRSSTGSIGSRSYWVSDNSDDNFPNKRRRF